MIASLFQARTTALLEPIIVVPQAITITEMPSLAKVFKFGFDSFSAPPQKLFFSHLELLDDLNAFTVFPRRS